MTDNAVENMSFEECMKELNDLINKLESGELDLDASLKVYERAVAIRERCRNILDDAERKVQAIMVSANGERREDFTESE